MWYVLCCSHYLNVNFEFFMNNMYSQLCPIMKSKLLYEQVVLLFFILSLHFLSEWKIREYFGKKIWIQILNYFEPNVMPYPRSKDDERQKGLWKCLGPGSSPPSPWLNTVDDYLFKNLAIFKVPFIVYSNQISLWIMMTMSVKNWRLFLQAMRY